MIEESSKSPLDCARGGQVQGVPSQSGAGKYRCTSEADCAEQLRVLRFLESRGLEGATFEEMEAALDIPLFRLAAVVEWMELVDGFVVWAFAMRPSTPLGTCRPIKTGVVRAARLSKSPTSKVPEVPSYEVESFVVEVGSL